MLSNGVNAASTDLLLYDQTPKNNPKIKETGAAINTNESVSIEGCHCPKMEIYIVQKPAKIARPLPWRA